MHIVIIDDDPFVTTSLRTILSSEEDLEVVGVGHDGTEALALYEQHRPEILLLDIQMTEMDGLTAARRILDTHPEARIIFLTTFASDEYIVSALKMGAKGYLIKQEVASIAPALRTVMAGQNVLGSEVLGHMESLMSNNSPQEQTAKRGRLTELSEREYEIVELIAQGLDNRDIAGALFISEGTVRNYISAILTKLALKNRTQLAVLYYQG
jgi:DNA-binding NarL/FixJ family response regulator